MTVFGGGKVEAWEGELKKIVDTEDYFRFFGVEYDPKVVSVNRLHILRKFGELREGIEREWPEKGQPDGKREAYARALERAYETFLTRTPQEEALFKVFRQNSSEINVAFHPDGIGKNG